jgi:hypothetical protein
VQPSGGGLLVLASDGQVRQTIPAPVAEAHGMTRVGSDGKPGWDACVIT